MSRFANLADQAYALLPEMPASATCTGVAADPKVTAVWRSRQGDYIEISDEEEVVASPASRKKERKKQRAESQKKRRHALAIAEQAVSLADCDQWAADKLIAELLSSPAAAQLAPLSTAVLQDHIGRVKDDYIAGIKRLCDPLPEKSRFKIDIVDAIAHPSSSFTKKELMQACGVNSAYLRIHKAEEKRNNKAPSHPLYEEKMRGFASGSREAVSPLEKELIVEWARGEMMVRSGCHRETFRLEQRKLVLVENFHAHYAQLLRQMNERDPSLAGSLLNNKTPITIFQRNMRRAIWLGEQDGFEEGKAADAAEKSLLRKRIAEKWKRGLLPEQTIAQFDPEQWVNIVHRSPEWFWRTLKEEGCRFRRDYTPYI
jgi:hypothetical protein